MYSGRFLAVPLLVLGLLSCQSQKVPTLMDGDILFQDFDSPQSGAIKLATHSEWSHCGILFYDGRMPMVWEAVQPVKITPLKEWVARNDSSYFEVRRIKNRDTYLTDEVVTEMKAEGTKQLGKAYDIYFNWGDNAFYCSEYVWKIYNRAAGIEVGIRHPLREYDLSNPTVKAIMADRYGDSIPADEMMVSPEDIFLSDLLEPVKTN